MKPSIQRLICACILGGAIFWAECQWVLRTAPRGCRRAQLRNRA